MDKSNLCFIGGGCHKYQVGPLNISFPLFLSFICPTDFCRILPTSQPAAVDSTPQLHIGYVSFKVVAFQYYQESHCSYPQYIHICSLSNCLSFLPVHCHFTQVWCVTFRKTVLSSDFFFCGIHNWFQIEAVLSHNITFWILRVTHHQSEKHSSWNIADTSISSRLVFLFSSSLGSVQWIKTN